MKTKKSVAIDYINKIRAMSNDEVLEIIKNEVGEELSQFFINYTYKLMNTNAEQAAMNSTSLMLLGYLIHKEEVSVPEELGFHQRAARA